MKHGKREKWRRKTSESEQTNYDIYSRAYFKHTEFSYLFIYCSVWFLQTMGTSNLNAFSRFYLALHNIQIGKLDASWNLCIIQENAENYIFASIWSVSNMHSVYFLFMYFGRHNTDNHVQLSCALYWYCLHYHSTHSPRTWEQSKTTLTHSRFHTCLNWKCIIQTLSFLADEAYELELGFACSTGRGCWEEEEDCASIFRLKFLKLNKKETARQTQTRKECQMRILCVQKINSCTR